MTSFPTLDPADRQDFEARLARYSVPTASVCGQFVAPRYQHTRLSRGPESPLKPHLVPYRDLPTLKKMLGVGGSPAESAVARHTEARKALAPRHPALKPLSGAKEPTAEQYSAASALELSHLTREDLQVVHSAARSVLLGVPGHADRLTPLIDRYLKAINFHIVLWPFLNILVEQQAVLELDNSVNVLVAHKIVVETGGEIVARGELKVDATIIEQY